MFAQEILALPAALGEHRLVAAQELPGQKRRAAAVVRLVSRALQPLDLAGSFPGVHGAVHLYLEKPFGVEPFLALTGQGHHRVGREVDVAVATGALPGHLFLVLLPFHPAPLGPGHGPLFSGTRSLVVIVHVVVIIVIGGAVAIGGGGRIRGRGVIIQGVGSGIVADDVIDQIVGHGVHGGVVDAVRPEPGPDAIPQ